MVRENLRKSLSTKVNNVVVFNKIDYIIFTLLTLMILYTILYFFFHWFSFRDLFYHTVNFSILTVVLSIVLINNLGRWFLLPFMKKPRPMEAQPGWKVAVVTTFVPGAESFEMLEETVRALVNLEYQHDTWVLDEGGDPRVLLLCQKLGARYFSRRYLAKYVTDDGIFKVNTKYGNYNAWLYDIGFETYDIITAFDPDHVPKSEFLLKVLGYFEDPAVAYVQTAQAYYNQQACFIARGAAEETYAYYSSVQMASYGMGYPVLVGSHNTHRVTALKQVGGFAPHDADDVLLTLHYRAHRWQGVYVPEILARGLTPVDWPGYLTQQRRWARSVLDIKLRTYPSLAKTLSIPTRVMSFLHGLNYLYKSVVIVASVILTAGMFATGMIPKVISLQMIPKLVILFLVLQLCNFYRQKFYLDRSNEYGMHIMNFVLNYAKFSYMLLAFLDVISQKETCYTITKKVRKTSKIYTLYWPNILIISLLVLSRLTGFILGRDSNVCLDVLASTMIIMSFALIVSERLHFPEPYDADLAHWQSRYPTPLM